MHCYTDIMYCSLPPSPAEKLCMEDYIAQQEIIVPVVVGGILSVLRAASPSLCREEVKGS